MADDTPHMTAAARAELARQTALDVLREDAELLEQFGEGLLEVSEQVKHGGTGKVQLTVGIKSTKKGGFSETVFIEGSVKVSPPPPPPTEQNLFFAMNGQLTRRDPRQPEAPLFKKVARDIEGDEVVQEEAAQ